MSTDRRAENFRVTADILREMDRQYEVWGEQNHPGVSDIVPVAQIRQLERDFKELNEAAARAGQTCWGIVLLEEVLEAMAEPDPVKRRIEIIQAGAVAASWAASEDRKAG